MGLAKAGAVPGSKSRDAEFTYMGHRFDRIIASGVLALIVAAPLIAQARPRVESVQPPPAAPTHQATSHGSTPVVATSHRAAPQRAASSQPAPGETARAAAAAAPAAEPAPRRAPSGFDTKGTTEKFFSVSDAQIGGRLRAFVTAKRFGLRVTRLTDREALATFYAARNYAPIWIHDGRLTARAHALIARLKDAASEGLVAAHYPVPRFENFSDAASSADGDLTLTISAMTFARHLQAGRIAPHRVFAQVKYPDHAPEPAAVLKTLTQAPDIGAALDGFDPPHAGFRALKAKLAELRAGPATAPTAAPAERIPSGPSIKLGARDPRVPLLRERLGLRGKPGDTTYDRALYNAVRAFQHRNGLRPDGIVGPNVIAAINGPKPLTKSQVIDKIAANMERWRWLPRNLGDIYVMVNIPDYTLKVVHDHRVVWRTKIVAGKPQTPTPLLTATMNNVIVNPSWYVPQSIIENELLPAYQSDPNIFDRMGLQVQKGPDGHINVVQPPGAANALGRIKFNFPNKFQVYLHDTPEKRLFRYNRRAFSHGCMRVQNPTRFGEIMLQLAMRGPTPSEHQIDAMFGRDEHVFRFTTRPMVHLTYQTAFVDENGRLQLRDDIYGFDARIRAVMHSKERRIADIEPPPDPKRDEANVANAQEILRRVERREALNPFRFFQKLFR
jgi:murein L,D-transpeptidase YcbB/YkuD